MATVNGRQLNTGIWIESDIATFNVATLMEPGQLGKIWESNGKTYQIVLVKSTSAATTVGLPVMWSDFDDYVVSSVVSDAKRNFVAGIMASVTTAGNYGVVQVAGPFDLAATDGLVSASGDVLVMSASDGQLTRITAGTAPTYIPLGVATSASTAVGTAGTLAAATVSLQIRVPLNL